MDGTFRWPLSIRGLWQQVETRVRARETIGRINRFLLKHPEITIGKARDSSGTGLHWYVFTYQDPALGARIKGSGFGFRDEDAILRAWGEFVERYSFRAHLGSGGMSPTSSGFASHTDATLARRGALDELVERDVFLNCWLLRRPASRFDLAELPGQRDNRRRLDEAEGHGFQVRMGVFGNCMESKVGIAVVYSKDRLAICTAAKPTLCELGDQLVREAASTVSQLRSEIAPEPLSELPDGPEPMDHLRLYLSFPSEQFLGQWVSDQADNWEVPPFRCEAADVTEGNWLAKETGYRVFHATSDECQNLWFGETKSSAVNLERLARITGRAVSYGELHQAPHPLA